MPEMTVTVRWPDGRVEDCWSPSLVMHDHLAVGGYTVADFRARATHALHLASERVRARYGIACTSAMATTEQIAGSAAAYAPDAVVEVVRMHPPLPDAQPADAPSEAPSDAQRRAS